MKNIQKDTLNHMNHSHHHNSIINNYNNKILEVKDGLQKVEIDVTVANFEPNQI